MILIVFQRQKMSAISLFILRLNRLHLLKKTYYNLMSATFLPLWVTLMNPTNKKQHHFWCCTVCNNASGLCHSLYWFKVWTRYFFAAFITGKNLVACNTKRSPVAWVCLSCLFKVVADFFFSWFPVASAFYCPCTFVTSFFHIFHLLFCTKAFFGEFFSYLLQYVFILFVNRFWAMFFLVSSAKRILPNFYLAKLRSRSMSERNCAK